MTIGSGDWWMRGAPLTDDSSLASSDLGAGIIAATHLDTATKSYIPGVATILVSSKSSNDEYNALIALYDVGGNAWKRRQHVRVYLSASTADAGGAIASTAWTAFGVKTSASTDVFSWTSTVNTGVAASTNTATLDKEFLTSSDGLLALAVGIAAANASTCVLTLDWAGGVIRSSDCIGTTVAAT